MIRNGFHWPLKRTSGVGERNLKRFLAGSLLFMHPYPCAQNQWKIFTNAQTFFQQILSRYENYIDFRQSLVVNPTRSIVVLVRRV